MRIRVLSIRAPFALLLAGLLHGCAEEDAIREAPPQISVCPGASSAAAECDRPLQLGELAITLPHPRTLWIHNRGSGPLTVSEILPADPAISTTATPPLIVGAGGRAPLGFVLTPPELGSDDGKLELISNDRERSPLEVSLSWVGTPKPVPRIRLCREDGTCATELDLDFGVVRRSQSASEALTVRNDGDAPLSILGVSTQGQATGAGELGVSTSTRAGLLAPGASAPLVVLYAPTDGLADEVTFVIHSDDPTTPEARVRARGNSEENLPPSAEAHEARTGSTAVAVVVGEQVVIDGRTSADPEGDPLVFVWNLEVPAGSAARVDDPAAGLVTFVPDRAGRYRLELEVRDTLGQPSTLRAAVLIEAAYRHALRVAIDWSGGGDVDLHFVPAGGALFSPVDCYFENRSPDYGVRGDPLDDPRLLADATGGPGSEEVVVVAPADGAYRAYAHYYDDAGQGAAEVTARVTFDDAGLPGYQEQRTLMAACDLWYIGEVVFPDRTFTAGGGGLLAECR